MNFAKYEALICESVTPKGAERWALKALEDTDVSIRDAEYLQELCKYRCNEIWKERRQQSGKHNKHNKH